MQKKNPSKYTQVPHNPNTKGHKSHSKFYKDFSFSLFSQVLFFKCYNEKRGLVQFGSCFKLGTILAKQRLYKEMENVLYSQQEVVSPSDPARIPFAGV